MPIHENESESEIDGEASVQASRGEVGRCWSVGRSYDDANRQAEMLSRRASLRVMSRESCHW
jgi:hypothetical protein